MTNRVTLLTGCNIGDKEKNMSLVKKIIEEKIGKIIIQSSIYKSEAWGFYSDDYFLNQALVCNTTLSEEQLLYKIWEIEKSFGKERGNIEVERKKYQQRIEGKTGYSSRNMDIDILFYNDTYYDSDILTIPHKMIKERKFVLEPLNEIMPNYKPAGWNKTINEQLTVLNQ